MLLAMLATSKILSGICRASQILILPPLRIPCIMLTLIRVEGVLLLPELLLLRLRESLRPRIILRLRHIRPEMPLRVMPLRVMPLRVLLRNEWGLEVGVVLVERGIVLGPKIPTVLYVLHVPVSVVGVCVVVVDGADAEIDVAVVDAAAVAEVDYVLDLF